MCGDVGGLQPSSEKLGGVIQIDERDRLRQTQSHQRLPRIASAREVFVGEAPPAQMLDCFRHCGQRVPRAVPGPVKRRAVVPALPLTCAGHEERATRRRVERDSVPLKDTKEVHYA